MAWGGSHAFMHPPSTPSEAFLISQPSEAHLTDPTYLTYLALSDHLSESSQSLRAEDRCGGEREEGSGKRFLPERACRMHSDSLFAPGDQEPCGTGCCEGAGAVLYCAMFDCAEIA